ncbi:MAG: D-sedoheptulose 7-phosphate isomerase [Bacteroidota bacterium]
MSQIAAKQAFLNNQSLLQDFIADERNFLKIAEAAKLVSEAFLTGSKVLSCGNGGSACDAMHFAQEFTGRFRGDRKALPVICISDPTHITCVGNDYGFDHIFSRGVEAYGQKGDILIALSTSGNSANIIKAAEAAQERDMKIFTLLGKSGGKLKGEGDIERIIPGTTSDRIQEIHMIILHTIIEMVERELFPENYSA